MSVSVSVRIGDVTVDAHVDTIYPDALDEMLNLSVRAALEAYRKMDAET